MAAQWSFDRNYKNDYAFAKKTILKQQQKHKQQQQQQK